jgi:beta-N-acetylhexosaminidase
MHHLLLLISLFLLFQPLLSQPVFLKDAGKHAVWADSVLKTMSLEAQIGQLIMVTAETSDNAQRDAQLKRWIKELGIGGVLFLKSTPYTLASRAQSFQQNASVPLFIAIDGENGLSFRLDSVVQYPHAMALGALQHDSLIYHMGREIGKQCKLLGIQLNFAPVADVNSNPLNPIINYRSFGEDPEKVARKSFLLAKGIQDEKVIVAVKHFPGHGDTGYDSHHTLPVNHKNYHDLKHEEFIPFDYNIRGGVNGIMSAHINYAGIDPSNLPATLSAYMMTDVLKDSLGFRGLVFSDGMNMKGITLHYKEPEACVQALKAGVDVIEFVLDPGSVIKEVMAAVQQGELSADIIAEKCRKVLMAKHWAGMHRRASVQMNQMHEQLNRAAWQLTARRLHEQAITVLHNDQNILPLQRLDTLRVATLAIGTDSETPFQHQLADYMGMDHFCLPTDASDQSIDIVFKALKKYNLVIAGVHGTQLSPARKYGVTTMHQKVTSRLLREKKTILVCFSNPYALVHFEQLKNSKALVLTYGSSQIAQELAAQLVYGAIGASGSLPVSIPGLFPAGSGLNLKSIGRLKYTLPEDAGFNGHLLRSKIDSMVGMAISKQMIPGCQVLVASKGKVIFRQAYGNFKYETSPKVSNESIYDWASITKICGPLPLLMKMTETGLLNLDQPFASYWTSFKGTDKEKMTLREILAHQAGFKAWVPIPGRTVAQRAILRDSLLRPRPSDAFPVRVSANNYTGEGIKKFFFDQFASRELSANRKYVYSDIGFIMFPELITQLKGAAFENVLYHEFLSPLGASGVHFNPYRLYPGSMIVPTECDDYMRRELVHGYVHDEAAALLGGVSGNAGLFGNANDLAKIMQFYLQKGQYGDFQYLKPATVNEFTRVQYAQNANRRALGFDKPYPGNSLRKEIETFPASSASQASFGHTGFTGNIAWADPKNQLVFIFLSNRVYPTRDNKRLILLNIRPILHQEIYRCANTFQTEIY